MHVLYLSHTGMSEPLGHSQVLPYLRGLARLGHTFDLVSFEPARADPEALATLRTELAPLGINHIVLARSSSPAMTTKLIEAVSALARGARATHRRRPDIVHARSTLPSAVALAMSMVTPGARMLFDCRGLLGEEYVDAGHWRHGELKYRLASSAERLLFRRADGVVVLTESLKDKLLTGDELGPHTRIEVVPCCVDTARFERSAEARARTRTRISAGDRLVVAYSGTLGSWYCEEEMARFFKKVRDRRPALFLVLTRSPTERLSRALRANDISIDDVRVEAIAPRDMPDVLAGADVGLSFISPSPSKLASSPTKVAEYLASGLRVVMNRGVGDAGALLDRERDLVDANDLSPAAIDTAALRVSRESSLDPRVGLELAKREFDLQHVGVARYAALYERLAAPRPRTARS